LKFLVLDNRARSCVARPPLPSRSVIRPSLPTRPAPYRPSVRRPVPMHPQPLKQVRYPWGLIPKEKSMTIAAGFRVANGVLIGADTRVEEGYVKYEANKIFECTDGADGSRVLFVGAGDFESISYCADLIRDHGFEGNADNIRSLKERFHKFIETKRYRRLIERTKAPSSEWFTGIVALRSNEGDTDLLYLSGQSLYSIPEYKCIGSGSETALFVSKWLYRKEYPIDTFIPMAIQVFRAAKGHNTGCDDSTRIIRLYNSGVDPIDARRVVWGDADYLWGLHDLLGNIIQGCFDQDTTDESFEGSLHTLDGKCRAIRESAKTARQPMPEAVKAFLKSTTDDPQSPPPSLG
jgi:20S proteasome alpha/beta subunit